MESRYPSEPYAYLSSEFVAAAVFASLQDGQDGSLPLTEEAAALDRRPFIDLLRERVGSADRGWLIGLVDMGSDTLAGLAVSLLRHEMDAELFEFYVRKWRASSPYLKNRLMWRMLDYDNLEPEWHHHFFEFVRQNWEVFRSFNVGFYGGPDVALNSITERLDDPTFPLSKKWIYACCVPEVVPPGRTACSLFALARQTGDVFATKVVDYLEHRFSTGFGDKTVSWTVQAVSAPGSAVEFVVQAVLERLRAGVRPTERCGNALNRPPIIDELQRRVRAEDLMWIKAGLEVERGSVARLFRNILKAHELRDDFFAST